MNQLARHFLEKFHIEDECGPSGGNQIDYPDSIDIESKT